MVANRCGEAHLRLQPAVIAFLAVAVQEENHRPLYFLAPIAGDEDLVFVSSRRPPPRSGSRNPCQAGAPTEAMPRRVPTRRAPETSADEWKPFPTSLIRNSMNYVGAKLWSAAACCRFVTSQLAGLEFIARVLQSPREQARGEECGGPPRRTALQPRTLSQSVALYKGRCLRLHFCNRFRARTTAPSGPALSPSVPETIFTRSAS